MMPEQFRALSSREQHYRGAVLNAIWTSQQSSFSEEVERRGGKEGLRHKMKRQRKLNYFLTLFQLLIDSCLKIFQYVCMDCIIVPKTTLGTQFFSESELI
jgi:hypothetical protein